MFEGRPHMPAVRGLLAAVWLALLAGCLPRTNNPAAPVPTGLAATAGDSLVTLTWTASTGATGYNVKRATQSGGPYSLLAKVTSPGYSDSTVVNGTKYYYVVSSLNLAGESANSVEVSATPEGPTAPPPVPVNVAATAGDMQVSLTWSASTTATSYHVKRATVSGGPYTVVSSPTTTSFVDVSLTNDTTYYYIVSAINSAGESPNSVEVHATPEVMNPPPTTFGTWTNVSPSNVDLTDTLCGNFGATTIAADPANPSHLYTEFNCQGIWKSTDYGATWTGPINTGTNGPAAGDCVGTISISPTSTASVPTIYEGCIRGNGIGFWKSADGGVSWTQYNVAPGGSRQDYFAPVVDPYDQNHLLMPGHEQDSVVESIDGGQTWTAVSLDSRMLQNGGSPSIFFINTGNASTTRETWLFMASAVHHVGTWRTTNGGSTWAQVDANESFGSAQIYQPQNDNVIFMAGTGSSLGAGVLRSHDYGQTWTHQGVTGNESVVLATSKNFYAMAGAPVGISGSLAPDFEVASQPGTGTWVEPGTPAALNQGTGQIATVNNGTHNILVGAMYNSGIWRYVEP
jgi:fibronectin type 3 domain-containing protein